MTIVYDDDADLDGPPTLTPEEIDTRMQAVRDENRIGLAHIAGAVVVVSATLVTSCIFPWGFAS